MSSVKGLRNTLQRCNQQVTGTGLIISTMGISSTWERKEISKMDLELDDTYQGIPGPGTFKLDFFQPVKLILLKKMSTFSSTSHNSPGHSTNLVKPTGYSNKWDPDILRNVATFSTKPIYLNPSYLNRTFWSSLDCLSSSVFTSFSLPCPLIERFRNSFLQLSVILSL